MNTIVMSGPGRGGGTQSIAMVSSGQEAVDWSQHEGELRNRQVETRVSFSLVNCCRLGYMNLPSSTQSDVEMSTMMLATCHLKCQTEPLANRLQNGEIIHSSA